MGNIARRDFLKSVPAAAGVAAYVTRTQTSAAARPADIRISGTAYTPVRDYPIQPKRYSEVTITDSFWKPKIATNAEVTIPFEVLKLSEMERGFGGNVLEAAILSL